MRVYNPSPPQNIAERLLDWLKRAFHGLRASPPVNDGAVARMLAEAGLSQADFRSRSTAGPKQRRRMAAMMQHFGIAPETAAPRHWGALREAQRVCAQCPNVGRCHRWLTWGRANDAPRVFCPNAALYDEVACDARREESSG